MPVSRYRKKQEKNKRQSKSQLRLRRLVRSRRDRNAHGCGSGVSLRGEPSSGPVRPENGT